MKDKDIEKIKELVVSIWELTKTSRKLFITFCKGIYAYCWLVSRKINKFCHSHCDFCAVSAIILVLYLFITGAIGSAAGFQSDCYTARRIIKYSPSYHLMCYLFKEDHSINRETYEK